MSETLSINVAPDPVPNPTLEQELAAQEAAKAAPVEPAPSPVPDKFKKPDGTIDVEALAKSYRELESKLGAPKEETPEAETTEEEPKPKGEDDEVEKTVEDLKEQGLDIDSMSARFWEKGEVDEEDFKALEAAGIPRDVVKAFAEGQIALQKAAQTTVFNMVGGEEAYGDLTAWAADTLSEAEVDAYNEAVNSNDLGKVQQAVLGLKARREAAVGFEPQRTVGGNIKPVSDVYESIAQLKADMSKPEYRTDPAFRAKVEQKLARSNIM